MDSLATITSISLQWGVPLKDIVKKMIFTRFEPSGFTTNSEIRTASSIVDYIFRWIGLKFLPEKDQEMLGLKKKSDEEVEITGFVSQFKDMSSPLCEECGMPMQRKGTCFQCVNCGNNGGSCG
jgi:ribonucleoside-diphosphate reductase alpha chain